MNLEKIAKLAGVSKSAVSLALNGKPGVSAETRKRIIQIAQEHGYTLKSRTGMDPRTSKVLTFLAFTNTGLVQQQYYEQPFFRELIQYIEERCSSHGYSLLYSTIDTNELERNHHATMDKVRGNGLILLGTNLNAEQLTKLVHVLGPYAVVLDTMYETIPINFIGINNYMGGYQAGEYLCNLGHKRFGYLASSERIRNFEERKRGFMAALTEHHAKIPEVAVFTLTPSMIPAQEEFRKQLSQYLDSGNPLPTAFFCECDYIAIGAIKAMQSLGIRIPEDVSVVGFDNISEATIITPEMTTIHVAKRQLAYQAVDLLVRSLEQEDEAKQKILVDTQLIKRSTTARPAAEQEYIRNG